MKVFYKYIKILNITLFYIINICNAYSQELSDLGRIKTNENELVLREYGSTFILKSFSEIQITKSNNFTIIYLVKGSLRVDANSQDYIVRDRNLAVQSNNKSSYKLNHYDGKTSLIVFEGQSLVISERDILNDNSFLSSSDSISLSKNDVLVSENQNLRKIKGIKESQVSSIKEDSGSLVEVNSDDLLLNEKKAVVNKASMIEKSKHEKLSDYGAMKKKEVSQDSVLEFVINPNTEYRLASFKRGNYWIDYRNLAFSTDIGLALNNELSSTGFTGGLTLNNLTTENCYYCKYKTTTQMTWQTSIFRRAVLSQRFSYQLYSEYAQIPYFNIYGKNELIRALYLGGGIGLMISPTSFAGIDGAVINSSIGTGFKGTIKVKYKVPARKSELFLSLDSEYYGETYKSLRVKTGIIIKMD